MQPGRRQVAPYRPFKYPPDFTLARIHQKATMPGTVDAFQPSCPCCNEPGKKPFDHWWGRLIEKDFKDYGGGVVSHFWLSKLYFVSIIIAIVLYGIYLQYVSYYYCSVFEDPVLQAQACRKLFGVWIITNEDLYDFMIKDNDHDSIIRFSILRSILFIILITTNTSALYLVRMFKSRYPDKPNVSKFTLLFKNTPESIDQLLLTLRAEFGNFGVHQAFIIKQAEPFYTHYKQKLETYFECKLQENPKKLAKLQKKLRKLQEECSKSESEFSINSRRAIIVFYDYNIKQQILKKYKVGRVRQFFAHLGSSQQEGGKFICEQCPKLEQLIWHNLGIKQSIASKSKLKSILLFLCLLVLALVILFLISRLLYLDSLKPPLKNVVHNVILVIAVIIVVVFRHLMDKVAEVRFPYTITSRAFFIVITSVLLHFIFYVWLPSIYLGMFHDIRGETLRLMSNQALMAVVVQIILTYVDLFYCFWNKKKKKVEDEDKPYACQKILHENMQYPRFPIQFKIIVLFKFWSLITFFGFHVPIVVVFLLIALLFHFIKDKFNIYFHYRTEIIDNKLQFNFLRIYTNLFTISMYITFLFTQHHILQKITSSIITVIALFLQIVYFRSSKVPSPHEEEQIKENLLTVIKNESNSFYKQKHDAFFEEVKSESLDQQIKHYLLKDSFKSSESSIDTWSINPKST